VFFLKKKAERIDAPATIDRAENQETAARFQLVRVPGGGLYALCNGRARKFGSMSVVNSYPKSYFSAPRDISEDELAQYKLGPLAPRHWTNDDWQQPPLNDKIAMRQIIVSQVRGTGIEFGAGARPTQIPLEAEVRYAEPYFTPEQMERMYGQSKNYMIPDLLDFFDNQTNIPEQSVDFIIAAHVIEHTKNPIKAFVDSYRALRDGGQLILIVPDKRYTFDKPRHLTTVEHLVEDYRDPSDERDFDHYLDYHLHLGRSDDPHKAAAEDAAAQRDLHFHVWNYESFGALVAEVRKKFAPFSSVYSREKVDDPQCLENYFVLTK
jgi:predicted SAM-dependent methyltransferase